MKDEAWLFVYGTLQPGLSNYHVIQPWVREAVPGLVGGHLVDAADGLYPALVMDRAGTDAATPGWWLRISRDGLAAADKLEEYIGPEESNDYERIWVTDRGNASRAGWIYVWPTSRGCPTIPNSKWPPSPE